MATNTMTQRARAETTTSRANLPTVLAIVVTHSGRRWLKDCIVALNTQTYPRLDILVIDDASPDHRRKPTLKRIVKRHTRRRRWGFLRTARPLGFGGAINWALSRVRTDADLLLFIHDDAVLDPASVERMVARLVMDDSTAIVGPKVVSWDDPTRLEEIGMAVDRFGYPYKGLEEGEVDFGQHDSSAEAFYVTSTCLLIRHEVFRQLKGWDARMRAFSEDLDLCWRARLAGHSVRVEPLARARHAMALATGQRPSRFTPTRYFIRRNRLRAVAKNASAVRLIWLIPQFVLLTFAEMLGFIVLRQPREIVNLARALGWNLVTSPETFAQRARVQRHRIVTDRNLRRLMTREVTRVHVYVTHQAERLEQAWGRRAEIVARQTTQARAFGTRMSGWPAAAAAVAIVAVLVGLRHYLWAPPASVGELVPYPDNATALWRTFFSPWQAVGLGQPGPGAPALLVLGIFPLVTLGAAGAAQKLLIVTLGVVAFWGAYRLLKELVDRPARVVAAVVYAFGPLAYAGLRQGALGALVFGAMAPFVLHALVALTGLARPPGWNRGRAVATVALAGAVSAAFVPGSLALYALAAAVLAIVVAALGRRSTALKGFTGTITGLVASWVLLLPWSATWLSPGGPLDAVAGTDEWRTTAAAFRGQGFTSVVLGQTPDAPELLGYALPLLGVIAVVTAGGQRRRIALALGAVVVAIAWVVAAISAGVVRPPVASPTEAGVLASLAFAGLAGLAIGSFRLDLPRLGLGWAHGLTFAGVVVAAALAVAGVAPAVWRGHWAPQPPSEAAGADVIDHIRSLLAAEAAQGAPFRALWVGRAWKLPAPSGARPVSDHILTGPRGPMLAELFERRAGRGQSDLRTAVASIETGATDLGGSLLGAFNIRYIVVERAPGAYRWLAQRDLAVVRTEPSYLLLENASELARAGVYSTTPAFVESLAAREPTLTAGASEVRRQVADQRSASVFEAEDARGPGVVFLAENRDDGWQAALDGTSLERVDGGWGNAFKVPPEAGGELRVVFPRPLSTALWLAAIALAWVVVLGATLSRSRGAVTRARGPGGAAR